MQSLSYRGKEIGKKYERNPFEKLQTIEVAHRAKESGRLGEGKRQIGGSPTHAV